MYISTQENNLTINVSMSDFRENDQYVLYYVKLLRWIPDAKVSHSLDKDVYVQGKILMSFIFINTYENKFSNILLHRSAPPHPLVLFPGSPEPPPELTATAPQKLFILGPHVDLVHTQVAVGNKYTYMYITLTAMKFRVRHYFP
jgi:hypothetical protein